MVALRLYVNTNNMAECDVHSLRRTLRSGFWRLTPVDEAGTCQALWLGNPPKSGRADRRMCVAQPVTVEATVVGQSSGFLSVQWSDVAERVVEAYAQAVRSQLGLPLPVSPQVRIGQAGVCFRCPRSWKSIPEEDVPAEAYRARLLMDCRSKENPLPPAVSGGEQIVLALVCDQVLVVG